MPPTAATPRAGPSPPDSVVAPHDLGFTPCRYPPLAGPLSSSSGKPRRHGSEPVPDTEDDGRTPGSSEFFMREPPESPDDNAAVARTTFTYEQRFQLNAQVYVSGDLRHGKPPAERTMFLAFGAPKHAWQEVWRAAVDRWESQKLLVIGYDTPPSSSLIGSCTGEQGSTVGKSTISEQDDGGEQETQGLDVGSASIYPPKNITEHTEMLEQKNGDEDHLAVSCAQQVLYNGSNLRKNAACGGPTFLESHCSLPKNTPGKNMADIQEPCHNRSKSGPNSPRDIQIFSRSRIGNCIAEQGTAMGRTFISEQHSSKTHGGGDEASQGPDFGSDRNHQTESNIGKVDQVLYDDVNNLEKNTVCGEKTLLDLCFKCGKDGQLLKCRSCSIAAHGSCFASSVRFDGGQFDCPICFWYKAEKTLSEARKCLSDFLGGKRFAKQYYEQSTGNQQLSHKYEEPGHEKINYASDACPEAVVAEKTTTFGMNPGNVKSHEVGNSSPPIADRNIKVDKENGVMNSPMTHPRVRFQEKTTTFGMNPGNVKSHEVGNSSPPIADRNIKVDMNSPMTHRRVRFQEKETVISHSYGKASGRQDQFMHSPARRRCYPYPPECHSSPATPAFAPIRRQVTSTGRRRMTRWTREEETALREGVAKYLAEHPGAVAGNRNISWVRILEDGKDSFNPVRGPCDLRKKFARMKRGRVLADYVAVLPCMEGKE